MYYLRNWQVTFLLYTLGAKITEYIAKASMEPRDYRVVFLIQRDVCAKNGTDIFAGKIETDRI